MSFAKRTSRRTPLGRGVTDGVRETDPPRPRLDRGREEPGERPGPRPCRVLCDVHDIEPLADGELDGVARRRQDLIHIPVLCVLADRRASDEGGDLDVEAGRLLDARHGFDVGPDRAGGRIGLDREPSIGNLASQREARLVSAGPGAGKADVDRVDAEVHHEVEEFDLLLDRRILDGRILEAVAQRLVVQFDPGSRVVVAPRKRVPVVYQFVLAHVRSPSTTPSSPTLTLPRTPRSVTRSPTRESIRSQSSMTLSAPTIVWRRREPPDPAAGCDAHVGADRGSLDDGVGRNRDRSVDGDGIREVGMSPVSALEHHPIRLEQRFGLPAVKPAAHFGRMETCATVDHVLERVREKKLSRVSIQIHHVPDPLEHQFMVPDVVDADVRELRDRFRRLLDDPLHVPRFVGEDDAEPLVVLDLPGPDDAGRGRVAVQHAEVGIEERVHEHDEDRARHVGFRKRNRIRRPPLGDLFHVGDGEAGKLLRHEGPDLAGEVPGDADEIVDALGAELLDDVGKHGPIGHAE